jgi:hypothetical protein
MLSMLSQEIWGEAQILHSNKFLNHTVVLSQDH